MAADGNWAVRAACLAALVVACGGGTGASGPARPPPPAAPAPDRDRDRIPDADDRCPDELEVYNGIDDEDGCPDEGQVPEFLCELCGEPHIAFADGDDRLGPGHAPVLDALAAVLEGHPELPVVGLVGYASADEDDPEALACRRADAVLAAVVERGVDRGRLRALSAFDRTSAQTPDDPADAARDRIVEFYILPAQVRGYTPTACM